MDSLEKFGISKKSFLQLYEKSYGFNHSFNKNHPICAQGETFFTFLNSGSSKLCRENPNTVKNILGN